MAQPPSKRLRMTVSVGSGSEAATPASPRRKLWRQAQLMVLFLVRVSVRNTVTASLSQLGRMVQRHVDRAFDKYHGVISSKFERFQEQIEGLHREMKQLARLSSNRQAYQHTLLETNQELGGANGSNTRFRLCFLNYLKTPIYTEKNITAENNTAIKIGLFEGDTMITTGPLSKLKVEILVLRGDFSNDGRESWTEEEFNNHIVQGRDGQGFVLGGDCIVWLVNGEASLGRLRFKEGSSRTRSRKFIIGARVCNTEKTGVRVQEAVMKPVTVRDRRNEANEKRHPPKLDDEVYRLEEISKDGIYHQRLQRALIFTVRDFLKALNKDANKLREEVLQVKKQHNSWEKMVKHARECCLKDSHGLKAYNEGDSVVLFFDCVHFLVGAAFDGHYTASDKFNLLQLPIVDKLKKRAYDRLDVLPFHHIMEGGFPVANFTNANAGAGPSFFMSSAPQLDYSAHHAAHQVRGIEAVERLSHAQIEPSCANANIDPHSSIPDHRNYQYQGTLPSGQEQFPMASHTDWHQNPLGRPNSSHGTTEEFYPGAEYDESVLLPNPAYAINQPYWGTFLAAGAPGPGQVSVQSQMQAPLPSNGPSESPTSTQNQSNLAPQQWSQWHGSMPWERPRF